MNDPYDGGTHLPDIVLVAPVVVDGQVVALATTMTHHQDIGGKSPGSVPTDATEIFQEGFIIPPLKLRDRGVPRPHARACWRATSASRGSSSATCGHSWRPSSRRSQPPSGGGRRLGAGQALSIFATLLDQAERMTRACLAAIPDGAYTFTDYLDDDGVERGRPLTITATVTVDGDRLLVDFTGTSPQARGPLNAVPPRRCRASITPSRRSPTRRSRTTAAVTGPSRSSCRRARWSTRAGRPRSAPGRRPSSASPTCCSARWSRRCPAGCRRPRPASCW